MSGFFQTRDVNDQTKPQAEFGHLHREFEKNPLTNRLSSQQTLCFDQNEHINKQITRYHYQSHRATTKASTVVGERILLAFSVTQGVNGLVLEGMRGYFRIVDVKVLLV